MADLSLTGEVVVTSEKAEAAFDRVGDKATQMATEVAGAAGKAGQAVDGIGAGAEKSADKFTRPGWQGIYSRAVRLIDRGPYSHCELVFSDGMSGSASYIDGGVRLKRIAYDPAHWDFIDLPPSLEPYARDWFERNAGAPYDLMGNVRFVLPWLADSERGWFCSESLGAALGWKESWRVGPNWAAAWLRTWYPPRVDSQTSRR